MVQNLQKIFTAFVSSDKEDGDIGTLFGKIYNLLVLGKSSNLKFLLDVSAGKNYIEDFIMGFIQGTSDVPIESNQCIAQSKSFLPTLAQAFEKLFNAFKTRTGIKEAFVELMNSALKLKDVEGKCHFISLATEFISIDGILIIAKIGWRITKSFVSFVSHIKEAAKAQLAGDFKTTGIHVGALFQIIFEYHTQ